MSKNGFKKFKKNDFAYDDEEYVEKPRSHYLDRKKQRRMDRALRTKDITILTEEEEGLDPIDIEDEIWDDVKYRNNHQNSMRGQ
jgi:hypothetical protein